MFARGKSAITQHGEIAEAAITPDMDVIWIRSRMSVAVQQAVQSEATSVSTSRVNGKTGTPDVEIDVGLYQIALLRQNILSWQGPAFAGVPCTAENVGDLDPQEPLVQRVLQEISDRNSRRSPNAGS